MSKSNKQKLRDLFHNALIASIERGEPSVDVFIGYVTSGMISMIAGQENEPEIFQDWQNAQNIIFIKKQEILENEIKNHGN